MVSPLNYGARILVVAAGVLLYTLCSGCRASVMTDFAQVMAMLGAAVIIIPAVFFVAGGPSMFAEGVASGNVTPEQESFFSSEAFMNQRSEEHTSELQSRGHLVCRLLLEKKKNTQHT